MKRSREERFKRSLEELEQKKHWDREERFNRSVKKLEQRLVRAGDTAGMGHRKSSLSRRGVSTEEVYRDKNTLVEVTVHRRPQEVEHIKKKSITPAHQSADRGEKSSGKAPRKVNMNTRRRSEDAASHENCQRSVKDILSELRDIVKVSGGDIHELQEFFEELDDPSKVKPATSNSEQEEKIRNLVAECKSYKAEAVKYKDDCGVMLKQAEFSRDTANSLEVQVGDLKKIVSKLTKNNIELLDVVSEKINYEDCIAELEKKKASLNKQLSDEKSRSSQLQKRLYSAEVEAAGLRALSAELGAGLTDGLAALESVGPANRHAVSTLGDATKNILGITGIEDTRSDSDSAIDDPSTDILSIRSKCVDSKETPKKQGQGVAPQTAPVIQAPPHTLSSSPPTKIPATQCVPLLTTAMLDMLPPLPPSHSSTMVESPASPVFQPLPLDLSETVSEILPQMLPASSTTPAKQSLESKVSSFLTRLHQDSLQLQLSQILPQPQPYPGVSTHLSLSSSDTARHSSNSSLTEGRFLRGLESSIGVFQAELSKNSEWK